MDDLGQPGGGLLTSTADVGREREEGRRRRLRKLAVLLSVVLGYLLWRAAIGRPVDITQLSLPAIDPFLLIVGVFFLLMIGIVLSTTLVAGRSPHVLYRPEQIGTRMSDVVGIEPVKEDVVRSLNLFLAHKQFAGQMGGTPRRGLLFEGPPGTGKTHLAKAMAAEAGVPFLFVSATSFQSMYYGATARRIRAYFAALRKAARAEGGAIGFIEEIDAIAGRRQGMGAASARPFALPTTGGSPATGLAPQGPLTAAMISEGTGGVVNELLVQMQSFDTPTGGQRVRAWLVDRLNLFLPAHRQIQRPPALRANVLLIAATNRADNLDPALLRPGRFDRRLSFEPPAFAGRRALMDHFLATKAHDEELAAPEARDRIAAVTQGYTPVMIEHLFDEALVNALRRGARSMSMADVQSARLVEEVGLGQPVGYTDHELRLIATHEAGHAVVTHLAAPHRRMDVLTVVKRSHALGMLAHGDAQDVYTRSRSELLALIRIAMGGIAAEEVFFGETSTGPAGDLEYATRVAAQMVGSAGMAGSLVSLSAAQEGLAGSDLVGRVLRDGSGRAAMEDLLEQQRAEARTLIRENSHLVEALRDALLDRHELIGDQITAVLAEAARDRQDPVGSPAVIDLTAPAAARVTN